ncbi:hypothetical protein [Streptomyces lunalinharesii]
MEQVASLPASFTCATLVISQKLAQLHAGRNQGAEKLTIEFSTR